MFTEEKIIEKIKELQKTAPSASFKSRMEELVVPSFISEGQPRGLKGFFLSPRFFLPALLAFVLSFTTLTSVVAQSSPGDIFFPFKNTAVKIESAFIKSAPTPTLLPTPAPSLIPTPSIKSAKEVSLTPMVTKTPVAPTVKVTVKPTLSLIPSTVPTVVPLKVNVTVATSIIPVSPTPEQLLNFNVNLNEAEIHLSL